MGVDAKARRRKGENELSHAVIGAAIEVHRELGPGLLESVYEECLCVELKSRGIGYERQKPVPVVYKGVPVGIEYRMDVLVEGVLAIELKSSERGNPLHAAQLLTYLKLANCRLGLLINFGQETLRDGLERVVNGLPD